MKDTDLSALVVSPEDDPTFGTDGTELPEPPTFTIGDNTLIGPAVLCEGETVDWLNGPPLTLKQWTDRRRFLGRYDQYLQFYTEAIRIPTPPIVWLQGLDEMRAHAEHAPPLPHITTPDGGEIILGGPDSYTMFTGQPGSGKTWMAIHTALQWNVPTIWIATETPEDVRDRLIAIGKPNQILLTGHPRRPPLPPPPTTRQRTQHPTHSRRHPRPHPRRRKPSIILGKVPTLAPPPLHRTHHPALPPLRERRGPKAHAAPAR